MLALNAAIEGVGWVVLGLAVCGAAYSWAAAAVLHRFLRRSPSAPAGKPSITVFKPLHGDEPELYENLESLCAQVYPDAVRLILGVQDPADPALFKFDHRYTKRHLSASYW